MDSRNNFDGSFTAIAVLVSLTPAGGSAGPRGCRPCQFEMRPPTRHLGQTHMTALSCAKAASTTPLFALEAFWCLKGPGRGVGGMCDRIDVDLGHRAFRALDRSNRA